MSRRHRVTLASASVEVRTSTVHGLGVFASRPIAAGELIGVYAGKRYSAKAAARRSWDDSLTYLFELSDGTIIDGAQGGNATRHINHACAPNCQAVEQQAMDGSAVVAIQAIQPVRSGDELFLDYGLVVDDGVDPTDFPCRCGTPACRGTMVAEFRRADIA